MKREITILEVTRGNEHEYEHTAVTLEDSDDGMVCSVLCSGKVIKARLSAHQIMDLWNFVHNEQEVYMAKVGKDMHSANTWCKKERDSHKFFKKVSNRKDRRRNKASLVRGEENKTYHTSDSWDLSQE